MVGNHYVDPPPHPHLSEEEKPWEFVHCRCPNKGVDLYAQSGL